VSNIDEPVLGPDGKPAEPGEMIDLPRRIAQLVASQPYGVLCTHGSEHAYGSLIALAFAPDLRTAVFATPRATRKYRLLTEHDRMALVVDNRNEHPGDMMSVEAITVTGSAREVTDAAARKPLADALVARHPQLGPFVESESCALFSVQILRVLHVTRFQEVRQWVPDQN
jgi:nitroimidazol reductase NimA-like FMN-containing flavoprotein (pyridoxamine 5'-phosphate oxidase superfamily)